ncbi:MAG TPA: hypothetical protein VKT53_10485 [Candidatus Acidoferrum sp.]|nr:hypothetical protein [Candidatus Acidoferrum sp.]
MIESRRRILGALGTIAGVTAACQLAPALWAQPNPSQAPQYKPSPNAPKNENAPAGLDGPPPTKTPTQIEMNRQLQASLRADVEKLCAMANDLKEDMVRVNPSDTLSLAFVKKAQAIEKLAKQIKDHAKG